MKRAYRRRTAITRHSWVVDMRRWAVHGENGEIQGLEDV